MSDTAPKPRPQFRNINVTDLMHYRLPMAGKVSILHRISGAALFVCLPLLIALFAMSFRSEAGFAAMSTVTGHPLMKLVLLGLIWGYLHHFIAGVRHLWMDATHSVTREQGHNSAIVTLTLSVLLTLALGAKLFGLY